MKPENVLLEGTDVVKVIDFGTAQNFDSNQSMVNILGTPYYMAPEIFSRSGYNEKCDIWSVGVIMYILLTGRPPFYGNTDIDIIQRVKLGKYPTDPLV